MNILETLFETNLLDIATKGFNSFIEDYSIIYDKSLYAVFSDTAHAEFTQSNIPPFNDAMVAYPVNYVIKNKGKFLKMNTKFITIVRIDSDNSIKINEITMQETKDVYLKNGYTEQEFKSAYIKTKLTKSNSTTGNMMLDILKSSGLYRKLYLIYDTSKAISRSILSNDHASIAFIMKRGVYRYVTHYNNNPSTVQRNNNLSMRKLAAIVSTAMGTKISNDKAVNMFMDYLYWTVDGIEIKITKVFSGKATETHDGSYFVIEANTPNGILLHITEPEDDYELIIKQIKTKYHSLTSPNSLWEPQSRDIFLTGDRYDHKSMTSERQRFVDAINKYYPKLHSIGRRYNISLPLLGSFTEMDKVIIYHLVDDFIRKQDNPLQAIEGLITNNISVSEFTGYPATNNINTLLIKNIIMVYIIAQKMNPVKSGWYVF